MEIPNHLPILLLEEVNSTNDYLKELSLSTPLEEGMIVVAKHQNNGRGQRDKKWESEKGKNLLFSMYLDSTRKGNPFVLNMMVSLAVCSVLENLGIKHNVSIKWPNDVLVNGEKIAGILIENTIGSQKRTKTFIGVGLNVNQEGFANTNRKATSVKNILGKSVEVIELAKELRNTIWEEFQQGKWLQILTAYNSKLFGKGQNFLFSVKGSPLEVACFEVDLDGLLNLKLQDGEMMSFQHGEIQYLI